MYTALVALNSLFFWWNPLKKPIHLTISFKSDVWVWVCAWVCVVAQCHLEKSQYLLIEIRIFALLERFPL